MANCPKYYTLELTATALSDDLFALSYVSCAGILVGLISLSRELTERFTRPWPYSVGIRKCQNTTELSWKAHLEESFEKLANTRKWLEKHTQRKLG